MCLGNWDVVIIQHLYGEGSLCIFLLCTKKCQWTIPTSTPTNNLTLISEICLHSTKKPCLNRYNLKHSKSNEWTVSTQKNKNYGVKEEGSPFQITISPSISLDCKVWRELSFQHHSGAELLHRWSPGASVETLRHPGQVRRDKVEEALGRFSKRLLYKWYEVNLGCQFDRIWNHLQTSLWTWLWETTRLVSGHVWDGVSNSD